MRYVLALLVLVGIVALGTSMVAARPVESLNEDEVAQPAIFSASDVVKIYEVQAAFQRAASTKNLGLMTSLFTDDATLSMGGQTYTGKGQVRTFFATVAGSFQPQNHWLSLTTSPSIRIEDRGDRVRLYFESVYVDAVTMQVKAHLYADTTLVRIDGRWLILNMEAGPAGLLKP